MSDDERTVVWVSAGAASAVAAKLALAQGPCVLAYCDTGSEHHTNKEFLEKLESWFDQDILRLHSPDYASVDDVIERTRYIAGPSGARCTVELKRKVRFSFQRPTDRQVFGYTVEERHRAKKAEDNDPGINWWWPLIEANLTKEDTLAIIDRAGIALPEMYNLGYPNNNCIGCVKANNFTYWNLIRIDFPDVFDRRARQERDIGHSICSEETTPGTREKTPVWLDELDPERGKGRPVVMAECSIMCAIAEASL
jgi:3'-phosphoadenosine 5'-phosphosulfate sulfotransferase (PAPS reductase)/FAD synthetase